MEKIKLTFLGTSDAVPSAKRNHTAILLNYKDENILVDCGEGTQRQFRKARLNLMKLTKILITHWHGDHTLGLPGVLQSLALGEYNKALEVYGPRGIKKHFQDMLRAFPFMCDYEIKVHEVSGKFFETDDFYLSSEKMEHTTACNAYTFVKKGQLRIDREKLKKTKIPSGPLLKKLKEGKDISYEGKKFLANDLTYQEGDKKVSFVLDTAMNPRIVPFVKNSDILICESSFSKELESNALEKGHMTSEQAAKIAKDSDSKKLILTHISQRHEKNSKEILNESQKVFKNAVLAEDLKSFEV